MKEENYNKEELGGWKIVREGLYIVVAISVAVFAFCLCFRAWADKEVFVHTICFHRYEGTAVLVDKSWGNSCHWQPADRPKLDERWNTCQEFEVGETNYHYPEASYDCE